MVAALLQLGQTHFIVYKVENSQLLIFQIIGNRTFQIFRFLLLDLLVDLHQDFQWRCSEEAKEMKPIMCSLRTKFPHFN